MIKPLISIVIPSLNQVDYIEETIDSIFQQDYRNYELIIMDGGSKDGSQEIIKKYAHKISYWQSKPDRGQTDAIIEGFRHAKGDLLGWVNSDDILLPGCLSQIVLAHNRHPDAGLYGGNYLLINAEGIVTRCKKFPRNPGKFARVGLFFIHQPGSFFKSEDYFVCGGLNVELHYVMDKDLYIRMLLNGTRFEYINEYLAGFRVHPESKMVSQAGKAAEEWKYARNKYLSKEFNRFYYQKTKIGLLIYYSQQMLNGKYLQAYRDYLSINRQHWRSWKGPNLD